VGRVLKIMKASRYGMTNRAGNAAQREIGKDGHHADRARHGSRESHAQRVSARAESAVGTSHEAAAKAVNEEKGEIAERAVSGVVGERGEIAARVGTDVVHGRSARSGSRLLITRLSHHRQRHPCRKGRILRSLRCSAWHQPCSQPLWRRVMTLPPRFKSVPYRWCCRGGM
jgi:hypothetical protein